MDNGYIRLVACRTGNFKLEQSCKGSWMDSKGVYIISSAQ